MYHHHNHAFSSKLYKNKNVRCVFKATVDAADKGRLFVARQIYQRGIFTMVLKSGLWSRSPSNFGWLEREPKVWMVEPEPEIWVPVPQNKFVGQATCTNNTMFLVFSRTNRSGAGAGVKNFRCWIWSQNFLDVGAKTF